MIQNQTTSLLLEDLLRWVLRDIPTSNPLAANAGLDILKKGGHAVDAAVCTASVLNVVEPMSTDWGRFLHWYTIQRQKVLRL